MIERGDRENREWYIFRKKDGARCRAIRKKRDGHFVLSQEAAQGKKKIKKREKEHPRGRRRWAWLKNRVQKRARGSAG